jgi:exo-1,4-beta-D-glucosaminidase
MLMSCCDWDTLKSASSGLENGDGTVRRIRIILLVGLAFLTALCAFAVESARGENGSSRVFLREQWAIQSSDKVEEGGEIVSTGEFKPDKWHAASVPSTVLAALCERGVFPDPYFGENLRRIPGYKKSIWYSMPDDSPFRTPYWYRTEFRLPKEYGGRRIWLHFDGINYKADIWLNGDRIADSSSVIGMFRRFAFDVTDKVTEGKNCLAVRIIAPAQSHGEDDKDNDMECTSSWDDHCPYPPDAGMGIWRDVYVKATGPVTISHPMVVTDLDLPSVDVAHLTISAEVRNGSDKRIAGLLRAVISDVDNLKQGGTSSGRDAKIEIRSNLTLKPLETRQITLSPEKFNDLDINNVRLWWPNPLGPQNLYNLRLEFETDSQISDSACIDFGIRELTTSLDQRGWRVFRCNGRKILGRGGTWMTSDLLLRFSRERYEAMLRYAKEMNWNLMRVEGYSIKELPEFYDMCDKYGIMIAPEIFARNTRDHKLQLECFKDHLLEIRHHPCVIHFIGHDETVPSRDIDSGYKKLIRTYAPHITYQAGSGGTAEERRRMGGSRTGGPWNFSPPSYYYGQDSNTEWTRRLRSYASGATYSGGIGGEVAVIESLHRFLPEEQLWPPSKHAWRFHTICSGTWLDGDEEGRLVPSFTELLNRRYGEPKSIEEFSYRAQIMTFETMRALHEVVAGNKYDCTFLLTWKFNAPWPTTLSWNVVDWYLAPTGAYYGTKKACEPLHVQYSYDDDTIYLANGYYRSFDNMKVSARLFNFDMTRKYSRSCQVDVPADSSNKVFAIDQPDGLTKTHFLTLELRDGSDKLVSSNFYWLSSQPDKAASFRELEDLAAVDLDVSCTANREGNTCVVDVSLSNPSSHLAFGINPKIKKGASGDLVLPVYWQDNYFSLLPGEKRQVKVEFDMKDLGTAQPLLTIGGWNITAKEIKISL